MDHAALGSLPHSGLVSLQSIPKNKGLLIPTKASVSEVNALVHRVKNAFKPMWRGRTDGVSQDIPPESQYFGPGASTKDSDLSAVQLAAVGAGSIQDLSASVTGNQPGVTDFVSPVNATAASVSLAAGPETEGDVGNHTQTSQAAASSQPTASTTSDFFRHKSLAPDASATTDTGLDEDSSEDDAGFDLADLDDVGRLINDMASISARNKDYEARASFMKEEAQKLLNHVEGLRHQFAVEQARRQRAENYFEYWRVTDRQWSFPAIWDSKITLAPVESRFANMKGSVILDMEISTSDEEELVSQWKRHDKYFTKRRKVARCKKAQQRAVDVEVVSDVETESDEEMFYSPFVLRSNHDDEIASDSQCHVYPFMKKSESILLNRKEDVVVLAHGRSPRERAPNEGEAHLTDGKQRARVEQASVSVPAPEGTCEDAMEVWKMQLQHDRAIAAALGEEDVGEGWDGLGNYVGGWRVHGVDEGD
ncbi:hypothetical protein GGX14DRAFT_631876 [Mycena pura]|uniref:Uncharacterized protein n=1 Tax=Mycena pura TaxID=153505 RepID=A0AAD6VHG7_9AGAR|nr:hypothetical protein GGX14DRAFT_631876 [Mycena pura]